MARVGPLQRRQILPGSRRHPLRRVGRMSACTSRPLGLSWATRGQCPRGITGSPRPRGACPTRPVLAPRGVISCARLRDVSTALERLASDERLPNVELTDHAGNRRRLSELVGCDPTVLQFYRGWWCPKEQA